MKIRMPLLFPEDTGGSGAGSEPTPGTSDTSASVSAETTTSDAAHAETTGSESAPDPKEPVSNDSIVAQVFKGLEADTPNEPAGEKAEKPTEKPAEKPKESDEDPWGLGPSHMDTADGKKRVNLIPQPRVKEMIGKVESSVRAAFNAPADLPVTEVVSRVKGQMDALFTEKESYASVEKMMLEDCETFLERLPRLNPRYAELLQARTAPAPPPAADMPPPNAMRPDGSRFYDETGLQGLLKWYGESVATKTRAEIKAEHEARIKPLEDAAKARKVIEDADKTVEDQIRTAANWPRFNEPAVAKAMADAIDHFKGASLAELYIHTVVPMLVADRAKIREEVVAELKTRPLSTNPVPGATAVGMKQSSGPKTNDEIVAEVFANLQRK